MPTSRWSIRSERSLLSVASTGSVLSIGSVGSFASVGSVLSARSRWSLMSDRSTNAVQGVRRAHRHAGPLPATTIVAAVALAAVAGRALELRRRRVAVPSA